MRYFFDTEFFDNGTTVEPISIGVVAEDGREFYAVWDNALEVCRKDQWLWFNVAPHLPLHQHDHPELDRDTGLIKSSFEIRDEIHEFLSYDGKPELWGWFVSYDHLVLSQLWGKMIAVPDPIPQFSNDIRSLVSWYGIKKYPSQASGHHNALADARHNKVVFDYIMKEIGND